MTPRRMARLAGVLYLVESLLSVFGQLFVAGRLVVRGDAAATAGNILANEASFRSAIAASSDARRAAPAAVALSPTLPP
ncbi:MAG: DUF4386 family protein [Chloroflexi bacterium]|nr:DUF4386 family protein [Chloroflexota bacterium]